MNEDLHDIDGLFKKALEENTESASSAVWNNIDKNLDKKKVVSIYKKYNILKWSAAILLLFSLGLAMYTIRIKKQNKELVKQNREIKNVARQDSSSFFHKDSLNATDKKTSKKLFNNTKPISDSPGIVNNIITNAGKDAVVIKNKNAVNNNTLQHATAENRVKNNVDSKNKNSFYFTKKTTIKIKADAVVTNVNAGKKKKAPNITATAKRFSAEIQTPGIDESNNDDNINIQTNTDEITFLPELKNNKPIATQTHPLQINKKVVSNIKSGINKKNIAANKSALQKRSNSLFSITALYSPDVVFAKTRDDHPRFREEERDQIEKNETIKFSSTIGLLLNYTIGSKWKLESGITYSSRKTNIQPKTIYARPDNNGHINYQFNCSAGYSYVTVNASAMPLSGDSLNALSSKNTLNYIGIPLAIQYVFNANKWSFMPAVGGAFNFLTKGQIETTIDASSGNKNTSSNKIQGLKSSYISGMAGFAAQYNLNKTFAISFEPTARFALSSINNNVPVKTNLNSLGFVTGLVIKL